MKTPWQTKFFKRLTLVNPGQTENCQGEENLYPKKNTLFTNTINSNFKASTDILFKPIKFRSSLSPPIRKSTTNANSPEKNTLLLSDHKDNKPLKEFPINLKKLTFLKIDTIDKIFDKMNEIKKQDSLNYGNDAGSNIKVNKKNNSSMIPKIDTFKQKFFKIYKIDNDYLNKINEIKKQKNNTNLANYQSKLVDVIGDRLSKEARSKLSEKLRKIRYLSSGVESENISKYIEEIERKETFIIEKLLEKEKQFIDFRKTKKKLKLPLIDYINKNNKNK